VLIARDASTAFVPRAQRAALMTNADVSLTISLNNLAVAPWGTASDGGAQAYATANNSSAGFAQKGLDEWSRFTGRPNAGGVNQGGTNGTVYPYPEFAGRPTRRHHRVLLRPRGSDHKGDRSGEPHDRLHL